MSSFSKLIGFFYNDILGSKELCNQNNSCMTITGDIMNNDFYNDIISQTSYQYVFLFNIYYYHLIEHFFFFVLSEV